MSRYSSNSSRRTSSSRGSRSSGKYSESSYEEKKHSDRQVIKIKELNLDLIQPNLKSYMEKDRGGHKIVVIGAPGCFSKGTKILMYNGEIKNVEDVKLGEKVMGWDSRPRQVLKLCNNIDDMYEIKPTRGESYIVNSKHKLVLKSCGYSSIKKGTIIEIPVDEFLQKPKSWKERWCVFRTGVEFPSKEVKIDPYLVGLWLGNGTSATSEITAVDKEIVEYLRDFCEKTDHKLTNKTDITFRICSKEGTKGKNKFLNFLRWNNMLKNKHIPHQYKINDRDVRLSLLAGMIDSDGHYDNKGCGYDIIQKNETLLDDIIFLARSLGFYAVKKQCKKGCTYKGNKIEGTYYRTFIYGDVDRIPCILQRKKARPRKSRVNHLVDKFSIIPKGKDNYYGFTLNGDHRFLLSSFDVVRNTGKTTLIASLLYAKKHIIPVGMVISGTEDSNGFYRKMFPSTFVFNKYNEEIVKKFRQRQKIARKHLTNPWAVCLLDDCTDEPAIFRKPLQMDMYKNGRHYKMFYIVSLQYCMDVRPMIRSTVDGCFILREPSLKNRRSLYENYAGIIPDFKTFCDIMDQITGDYTALYIHRDAKVNKWEDCIYYYKAKPIPKDFKFGCREFYDFHFDRYNPEYTDPLI